MKLGKKVLTLFLLMVIPLLHIPAQTNSSSNGFDLSNAPQWVRDLRRWEIVAFGSIPFTMLIATFSMDMYRWNDANGLDFSDEGRRYAPWPLKSSGAIAMESEQQETVFVIAASLSAAVAFADLIIVQIKRDKARKRAEALPAGTSIINRVPLGGSEIDAAEISEELVPLETEEPADEQF